VVSSLFGPIVTTEELLAATGDAAWLAAMLDAEAALAAAQADVGMVPAEAAEAIGAACRTATFDVVDIGRHARGGGNPVIPLVDALTAAAGPEAGRWVHWGATSQDILDTAAMLVAERATAIITGHLDDLGDACASLAEDHRETLMVGRTLLQAALPITFGLKAAGWLAGVDAAADALDHVRSMLAVQLGGAAGTLASLGADGPAVVARFAIHVGLAQPLIPWHSARQRVSGLAGALGTVAATAAKISTDVGLLAQTEVAEAAEPAGPGRGGSSTLPHKRNPAGAAAVNAAARRALALVPVLQGSLMAEHERALGAWHAEWETLGQLLALAGGGAARTAETVAGLEIHADAMEANLAATGGVLLAERVVGELAGHTDRRQARQAVHAAVAEAAAGRPFADALLAQPVVSDHLDADRLGRLLDPAGYLGATGTWIERAVTAHRVRQHHRPNGEAPS
jgi:3-carboxy-cis,cis-muconate cycloisomerase